MGSPHSGTAHFIQEEWIQTTNGLGLADALMGDFFPNEYVSGVTDTDDFYQKKWIENCVGSCFPVHIDFVPLLIKLMNRSFRNSAQLPMSSFTTRHLVS